jgi:hypothetical protein
LASGVSIDLHHRDELHNRGKKENGPPVFPQFTFSVSVVRDWPFTTEMNSSTEENKEDCPLYYSVRNFGLCG